MSQPLLQLDLRAILAARIRPEVWRWVPRFLVSALERLIRQRELNEMLRVAHPREGSAFSAAILDHLNIRLEIRGEENIPPQGRFIFASNHPLGGLDGISLIKVLGERYGDDNVRFLVNDMLMNVKPLGNVFLPINKYGSQGREAARAIAETYEGPRQVLIFPAGLVSRRHSDGIYDLDWHKAFVAQAIRTRRDIVPLRFEALNSPLFYNLARWRKRLGIKVNLEQALLPSELCKCRDKVFRITFGAPVSWRELKETGEKPAALARRIKSLVYSL